ncbi:hydrogenase nickel incorporation protein HypB [Ectothiorhodospira sp. BSL-9]|uniref:hydrogenase nickel incorporation protein HypB n=1 Tax=Ectothiorhodospira sp. BSL-9 TaxID=1442136 RepID=UPI0007B43842|nr:hydrogenase nickel incorporation protein HypB [Ectothiorhodospira sp. BSL-9]ANB02944.1 hydrogenase nickel incorporation protein HypB [Ectothiorhodospira sp. BSL-9]
MCTVCGCGNDDHGHEHHGKNTRQVSVETDLLARNDAHAQDNRAWFERERVLALNLVSSPGSGKTSLLTATIEHLRGRLPLAVIEGDQQTSRDAERIRRTGVPAVQINTGKGCHLDAHRVGHACEELEPPRGGILFMENVGNLVCPAAFDLGEAFRVVVLSVTEGDDKPFKYPDMFQTSQVMIVNKLDLLPHVDFDMDACIEQARRLNPEMEVFQLSARTGQGMAAWVQWLEDQCSGRGDVSEGQELEALRQRVAELESRLQQAGLMKS